MKNESDMIATDKHLVSTDDTEEICPEGYLIIANDTSSGRPWCWGSPTLEFAKSLSTVICQGTGQVVRICKLVGVVQPAKIPTEYVEAKDLNKK